MYSFTGSKIAVGNMIVLAAMAFFTISLTAPFASAQSSAPIRVDADIPYEARAPWFNREHTEVEDEVLLQGTMHLSSRMWMSSPTHVSRITIHLNVVDVHGTSETTGQRFRMNGSYSVDLNEPEGTFGPDGRFNITMDDVRFFMHKVDPEPARLDGAITQTWTLGSYVDATPIPCEGIYAPDGTPTGHFNCGNFWYGIYTPPELFGLRVRSSGGSDVPNGAILFNGYAGDYYPPLQMRVSVWPVVGLPIIRFHCKTGNLEAPTNQYYIDRGKAEGDCSPFYSPTEPITVYADISILAWDSYGQNLILHTRSNVFAYRMLPRPIDHIPVIDPASFFVKAASGPSSGFLARCVVLLPCTVFDGDVLFNGQSGDFYPPLTMKLYATDADGDPLSVQWYCKTGEVSAPVVEISPSAGIYGCTPLYSSTESIKVYAVVFDGAHLVTSEVRTLRMLERIN